MREREAEARRWVDDQAWSGDCCDAARRVWRLTDGALLSYEKSGEYAQLAPLTTTRTIVHTAERQQRKPLRARPGRRPLPSVPLSIIGQHRWLCCHHNAVIVPHCPSAFLHLQLHAADQAGIPQTQIHQSSLLLCRPPRQTTTSWVCLWSSS